MKTRCDVDVEVHPKFVLAKPTDGDLVHRYTYHRPHGTQVERYAKIRAAVLECARVIVDAAPGSYELYESLHALDKAMMMANAAIARNEPETPSEPHP